MASQSPEEKAGRASGSKLIWCYRRGTIQYDIICALILAFIFFVPPSCFIKRTGAPQASKQEAGTHPSLEPQTDYSVSGNNK